MTDGFKYCEECEFADVPLEKEPCRSCNVVFTGKNDKPRFREKTKTNADRIRQMTDEELAEFLKFVDVGVDFTHYKDWIEWLKSPADKDGDA